MRKNPQGYPHASRVAAGRSAEETDDGTVPLAARDGISIALREA
jgi:hypothetical protein